MNLYDISWPISPGMTAYKDKKTVTFEHTKNFETDHARESIITLSSHSGTHIDAPAHFLKDGKTVDHIPFIDFSGQCTVIDMTHITDAISCADLEQSPINEAEIILLKTKNSELEPTASFNPQFIYLDASGAAYLAQKKIKAVGIDYLGIERNQPDHATHTTLMQNAI